MYLQCPFSFWINCMPQFLCFLFHTLHSGLQMSCCQRQAVQPWMQMGTSDWLEGGRMGSSHLSPHAPRRLYGFLHKNGQESQDLAGSALVFHFLAGSLFCPMASVLDLESYLIGLPWSFQLAVRKSGCHFNSNTCRDLRGRSSLTSMWDMYSVMFTRKFVLVKKKKSQQPLCLSLENGQVHWYILSVKTGGCSDACLIYMW